MRKVASRSLVFGELQRPARRPPLAAFKNPPRGPRHSGVHQPHGQSYKAGDAVPQSGIYEVVHDRSHRTAHEVVMLAGDAFPPCDTCDLQVRFKLIRSAPYIFQDADFEEGE
jgi:hypothetical protein